MPLSNFGGGGYGPPAPLPGSPREAASVPHQGNVVGETEDEDAVAFVYVPTRPYEPVRAGEVQSVRFELRQLHDGSPGLAVFTELQILVNALGVHQPYVKIAVLDLLVQVVGERISVVVDPALEHGVPQWTEQTIQDWRRSNNE